MDVFGGPVETPNMRRIADIGMRYANFHTTALCSPTRSSLLTGRNATSNGMATIAEFGAGSRGSRRGSRSRTGSSPKCSPSRGTTRTASASGTSRRVRRPRWPPTRVAGRWAGGSSGFYGFLGGESNSWYPDLVHDNHQVDPPATPEDGYHLSDDLSDKAIQFIRDAKVVDPDKPLLPLPGTAAGHAAMSKIGGKYKGRFDGGYEAIRQEILDRQRSSAAAAGHGALGHQPARQSRRPRARTVSRGRCFDTVRPWDF